MKIGGFETGGEGGLFGSPLGKGAGPPWWVFPAVMVVAVVVVVALGVWLG